MGFLDRLTVTDRLKMGDGLKMSYFRLGLGDDLGGQLTYWIATQIRIQGGNSMGFLDRLTNRLKMGNGLKMSDFRLGMSLAMI